MSSRLFLEKIASEAILRESATAEDVAFVEQFGSEKRRCEVLAWRAIVRRELGQSVEISHDENGAPQVDSPYTYISIAHSREMVAVAISDAPCAVDIEDCNRDFRRVASKYLSSIEHTLAEQYNLFAEMWSAKEALYKFYRRGGLNYVSDVAILGYDASSHSFIASICGGERVAVAMQKEANHIIALIG